MTRAMPGEVGGGPAGGPVGLLARGIRLEMGSLGAGRGVFPGVEAEAVEGADGSEEDGGGEKAGADPDWRPSRGSGWRQGWGWCGRGWG